MPAHLSHLFAAMAVCLVSSITALGAESYAVDASHSSVLFSIGHLRSVADGKAPVSYTYGMFRKFEGGFVIDRTNPANCQFQFAIDAASIDTNDAKRDEHLRGPDFFNARELPQITFQSTDCKLTQPAEGKLVYEVSGHLTLLGQTRQVTLPVEYIGEAEGPYGDYRLGFHSQFTIKRSDFEMSGMLDSIGDAVGITVSLEGIRQEESAVESTVESTLESAVQPASATVPAGQ